MTKDELTKVRDALSEGCGWSDQILANYDEKYARHPATEADREFITDSQNKIIEALDILGRALAAPEPEPVAWQERRAIYRKGGIKWSEWYPCDYTSKQVAAARESTPSDEYEWRPLFATPPSREWQELSPLEMQDTLRNCAASTFDKLVPNWYEVRQFARAIESALRAKNSGEQA